MCSGNYDNQKAALNGQVVDSINSILDLVPLSNVKVQPIIYFVNFK